MVLLVAAAVGVLGVLAWGLTVPEPSRWSIFSSPAATPSAIPWTPEPLPVPHASELQLTRARSLAASGRVHDALAALERIPIGDPLRPEADRLRADVQMRLLSLAAAERPRE